VPGLKPGDRVEIRLERAEWSVAVLNATQQTGVASEVADRLRLDFAVPAAADNAPALQEASHVYFTAPAGKPYAQSVAAALKIAAVDPLPEAWRGRYSQDVVVVLGKRMR
jgi:hypothetical protein